ncbi:MAG: hemerythrin family protein [Nitrospirae bacterium]|nr:hemerythrin family protein [Nitrospirota bacterium]
MALITWKEDLSVNIAEMDKEHKQLVVMINELHEAMSSGKGKDVLGGVLARLIDYTKFHFAAEEKLMESNKYPGYLSQKGEHDNLTKKVMDLKARLDAGNMVVTVEVMAFLKDWLTKHIMGQDKKYSSFLNAKGIK